MQTVRDEVDLLFATRMFGLKCLFESMKNQ